MSRFCHQVHFTSAAWSRILHNPKDCFQSLRTPIERLGGTLQSAFFAMDSFDVLAITEFLEDVSPSDISVAFSAGGEVAHIHTTRLLDASHAAEAMRRDSPGVTHPVPRERVFAASTR